jgi:glutaredoxin
MSDSMSEVYTVIWKNNCKWCDCAKALLTSRGEVYVPIEFKGNMKPYFVANGLETLPQIWLGEKHIGGYDDLVKHFSELDASP